ncbi:2OG-Fe dioxygenase family protein [Kitasatospora sp. A2-31]|uniref:2OG-Fe dioxygenase family protein n=1 Tax=Kitasatospora sp. A2-31 TaxID=2916414 RepID=UPI001EEAC4C9|nr:2OG-Fe dioxygenase family protein [Kitasatospora sp. A2-31]MCG6495824.1 2OG-Fe dioxygenase family protein [Kitasatospora sp. A2-31]
MPTTPMTTPDAAVAPDLPASAGRPAAAGAPETAPFAHFPSDVLREALHGLPPQALDSFLDSWNDLPADEYLGTDRPYRFRRYGRFRLLDDGLEPLPHGTFLQDRAVNSLVGGVPRLFAPLHDAVAAGPALRAVVRAFRERLPGPRHTVDTCGVHQIRVVALPDAEGDPAPEGVHQDGHSYVAQVLIRREGVEGAQSRLYDLDRREIHRAVLTDPLESIVLDDRRVLHDVSPITSAPGAAIGVRDMLLVDFFASFDSTKEVAL